jgi:hypothetical protein
MALLAMECQVYLAIIAANGEIDRYWPAKDEQLKQEQTKANRN